MSVNDYIKDSAEQAKKNRKERLLYNRIVVYIKDPLPEDFNLDLAIQNIENMVPSQLTYSVDSIFIGQFDHFDKNNTNAFYENGAIYTTNKQANEMDLIDDIVHELAHSIEEFAGDVIYADGNIENEFLGKRKILYHFLKSEGYDVNLADFLNLEYDRKFDEFLYKNVGYERLTFLTVGLFASPYGATFLKEYFANGFEHYFVGDREHIKNLSPSVYNKIEELIDYLKGDQ